MQIQRRLRRNLHLDPHALMHAEVNAPLVRHMDLQINFVGVLVLGHAHARVADGVAVRDDVHRNGVADAAGHFDGRVVGVDVQTGIVADLVGLVPLVRGSERAERKNAEQENQRLITHSAPPRCDTRRSARKFRCE